MRMGELSDLLSPILVKELRQGSRSRALVLLAVLTTVAAGLVLLVNCMKPTPLYPDDRLFAGLYGCLSVVGFLIFPLMAHRSLVHELEAGSWDILQLTGLGPRRIIAGKLTSSVIQMVILSLAIVPFLLICHFGDETDIVRMTLLCAAGAVVTGALTIVALFAATLPRTRAQRSVVQIALMAGLALSVPFCVAAADHMTAYRAFSVGEMLTGTWLILSTSYTLFEAAAARLSLAAEDYAWRPRTAVLVQLIGLTALGLCHQTTGTLAVDGMTCQLFAVVIIACAALGMATEADHAGPPRRRRSSWSPFAPGALSGFRLTVQLLALTTLLWGVLLTDSATAFVVAAPAYVILYLCAALWTSRALAPRRLGAPDATRGVFFVLASFGTLVPWVIGKSIAAGDLPFLMGADLPDRFWPGYISPAYGLSVFKSYSDWNVNTGGAWDFHPHGHWVLLALAVLAAVATDRMLARRARERA